MAPPRALADGRDGPERPDHEAHLVDCADRAAAQLPPDTRSMTGLARGAPPAGAPPRRPPPRSALGQLTSLSRVPEVARRPRGTRRHRVALGHARGRSARRPAPSAGTPAADHAAALWQLCCRIGHTTTVACQVVGSRSSCHRLQATTGAERGANAGTAQRARDGRRAYPANRHRVCIRTRSCVRRLTISIAIGAAFGYDTRAHALSRTLTRREASQCAVRPQSGQTPAGVTPRASWCLRGSTLVSPV